jgi:hypothetical protein
VLDPAFTLGVAVTKPAISAVRGCPKPAAWSKTLEPGTPRMTAQLKIKEIKENEEEN